MLIETGLAALGPGLALMLTGGVWRNWSRRPDAAAGRPEIPGPVLADGLSLDLAVWTVNGRGQQRKAHVTLQSIHGPDPDNPQALLGACRWGGTWRVVRTEEIVALKELETGEVHADARQLLRSVSSGSRDVRPSSPATVPLRA